jgi:hypothetical protein
MEMTMTDQTHCRELLPCPLCGGLPKLSRKDTDERSGYNFSIRITCGECTASIGLWSGHDKNGWVTESEKSVIDRVTTKWNTRAQASAPEGASEVCAQAYQVVGSLLSDVGRFDSERGRKILDNLSACRVVHDDVLPWPSFETAPEGGDKFNAWWNRNGDGSMYGRGLALEAWNEMSKRNKSALDFKQTVIDQAMARIKELEGNAGSPVAVRYFAADPAEGEFYTYDSLDEAKSKAEQLLEWSSDAAYEDGWADEPPQICYGIVLAGCEEEPGSRKPAPEGSDFTEMVSFRLTEPTYTRSNAKAGEVEWQRIKNIVAQMHSCARAFSSQDDMTAKRASDTVGWYADELMSAISTQRGDGSEMGG